MDDVRWLDDEERAAWIGLSAMLFTLPGVLEAQLQRDADLTMAGYMVLAMLSREPGRRLRMSRLAAATNSSQSRLSRVVGRLEEQGFVERSMDAKDRRAIIATLTPAGLRKLEASAPGHVEAVRRAVFDRLDRAQVRQLSAITRALADEAPPDRCPPSHPQ